MNGASRSNARSHRIRLLPQRLHGGNQRVGEEDARSAGSTLQLYSTGRRLLLHRLLEFASCSEDAHAGTRTPACRRTAARWSPTARRACRTRSAGPAPGCRCRTASAAAAAAARRPCSPRSPAAARSPACVSAAPVDMQWKTLWNGLCVAASVPEGRHDCSIPNACMASHCECLFMLDAEDTATSRF